MGVYPGSGTPGQAYNIYGSQRVPEGYQLVHALSGKGHDLMFEYLQHGGETITLSKSRSWVRMGAGISQLIFSCVTLYNARSDQIDRYGYAAFGLYVFPYIFMSFVNIVCIGFIGDYSPLYVVRTPVLLEAERRGGIFDGSVGTVEKEILELPYSGRDGEPEEYSKVSLKNGEDVILWSHDKERKFALASEETTLDRLHYRSGERHIDIPACFNNFRDYDWWKSVNNYIYRSLTISLLTYLVIIVGPYMVLYGFTRFHKRASTSFQRSWLITWIV